MSVAHNQRQVLLRLLAALRPHWRRDAALPARISTLFAQHREFGSRDRRLYRELIYTALRYLPWIEPLLASDPDEAVRRLAWFAAALPATKAFRAAFATGEPPTGDKSELLPAWFRAHCPEIFSGAELDAQLRRAPLWLRLQTTEPRRVLDELDAHAWPWRQSDVLPSAIELLADADVTKTDAWREGRVEVQDLGSQFILDSAGIAAGGRWLDACAGAGGKTLQLAGLLGAEGRIDAHDVRAVALEELQARAARARLQDRIRVLNARPTDTYDGVLVDAPCSGSGTWRRAPHLKWVTTEAAIARAAEQQRSLLDEFSARVRPGGRLIYATCSLSVRENEEVVAAFLAAHPELAAEKPAHRILPAEHNTDGFFVAALRRS